MAKLLFKIADRCPNINICITGAHRKSLPSIIDGACNWLTNFADLSFNRLMFTKKSRNTTFKSLFAAITKLD